MPAEGTVARAPFPKTVVQGVNEGIPQSIVEYFSGDNGVAQTFTLSFIPLRPILRIDYLNASNEWVQVQITTASQGRTMSYAAATRVLTGGDGTASAHARVPTGTYNLRIEYQPDPGLTPVGGADAFATGNAGLRTAALLYHYNGATWDRNRGGAVDAATITAAELGATVRAALYFFNGTQPARWASTAGGTQYFAATALPVVAGLIGFNNNEANLQMMGVRPGTAFADAYSASGRTFGEVASFNQLFNGTSWDRHRNNAEATVLASAARVATTNSADFTNYDARGVMLHLNITANPGAAETLTVQLQMKDPVSGTYRNVTAFPATATSNTDYIYTVYPGATETAAVAQFEVQGVPVPRTWRIAVTHSAAGSWTYSVGASYIK